VSALAAIVCLRVFLLSQKKIPGQDLAWRTAGVSSKRKIKDSI
jgi:hypothetical protein